MKQALHFCKPISVLCLAIALSSMSVQYGQAQPQPQAETKAKNLADEPSLKAGSAAPALKIDKWVKGEPLGEYSKDNFYVIEFWATWCVPCIKSMPHLNELAERYSKDGLEIVAVTSVDDSNTVEAVQKFVDGPGKKFRFRFGLCESNAMSEAFMVAAGKQAIPCSFVIDRQGNIAYIGLPSDLDYVLSRIAAKTWRGKADLEELEQMNQSIGNIAQLAATDPEKACAIIAHIEKVNPSRAVRTDFAYAKVVVLCQAKKFDEAKAAVESLKPMFIQEKDWGGLAMVAGTMVSKELNPQGIHREFAETLLSEVKKAAEDADDWQSLLQIAISFRLAGENAKCRECFDIAIAKCPDTQTKIGLRLAASRLSESP